MKKPASAIALADIQIDRTCSRQIYAQLAEQMRALIVSRRLEQGLQLPSSRAMAHDLGLARKTVVSAYDQLIAEGYLSAHPGAGTFVEDVSFVGLREAEQLCSSTPPSRAPNSFGEASPLSPCTPDMAHFPRTAWAKAAAKGQRTLPLNVMFEPPNGGYRPLQEALADHLWAMRGIRCDPEQIIITSGIREAFSLVCATLFTPGRHVVVEDPGYQAFPQILAQFGLHPAHTPVDESGIVLDDILTEEPGPNAVCVSASRQYPTGTALSLQRRAELISWAAKTNNWLIEDDYDCEFRFDGPPLQSIFAMDCGRRTIYFGSLSKTLFPRLRLSFLVAPANVVTALIETQNQQGSLASLPGQAALAEFIQSGQYTTHIRQMRRLYASRYKQTHMLFEQELATWLDPQPCSGGFYFAAYFKPQFAELIDDQDFARWAQTEDIGVTALSSLSTNSGPPQRGLIIGFAGTDMEQTKVAIRKLHDQFRVQLKSTL